MSGSRTAADLLAQTDDAGCATEPVRPAPVSRAPDRWALGLLHRPFKHERLRIALWDGTALGPSAHDAIATLVIRSRRALFSLLFNPEVAFGDGYASGAIEVDGDLIGLLESAYRAMPESGSRYAAWAFRPSHGSSRANVHYHYDLGNRFYQLWLDEQLVYTCAYFSDPSSTLEEAQTAKLDYVCRKLRLRPGERVIDAGCGWGALALHMASHYGVTVKAYNVSTEQIAFARERAQRERLAGRVEFIEDDYRNIRGACDAFVSVGMLEHVGRDHYRALGAVIDRTLSREGGRGLLHFIGRNQRQELSAWIRQRIFPGAYPPTLSEVSEGVFEPWNFSMLDVENLRLHYERTLAHWLERFETAHDTVVATLGNAFARAWRLYLAGSLVSFRVGMLQLFQITFARGTSNDVPWTRDSLYVPAGARRS